MDKNLLAVVLLVAGLAIGFSVRGWNGGMMRSDSSMMSYHNGNMKGMMNMMSGGLEGLEGDEFDKAFISMMIMHHEGAVDMAELALKNAKHEEIKDLSRAIITAQEKEIEDMKRWENDWYGR